MHGQHQQLGLSNSRDTMSNRGACYCRNACNSRDSCGSRDASNRNSRMHSTATARCFGQQIANDSRDAIKL